MFARTRQFLTVARLTAIESVRQPIFLLLAVSCVVLITLTPMMIMHNFGEDGRLARDSGLALHFVFGLFMAGYAASSSLSHEMQSGTASAVLCKPVSREIFFLAKFVGISAVLLVFSFCAGLATLMSERISERFVSIDGMSGWCTDWLTGRLLILSPCVSLVAAGIINYRKRRVFGSTAFGILVISLMVVFLITGFFEVTGKFDPFDFRVNWRVVPASLLVSVALVMLCAIAMVLSSRLGTMSTMVSCAAIFVLGLMSDYLFGRHVGASSVSAFFYWIVPNWQHFWRSDALTSGGVIPFEYVSNALYYAVAYTAGILALGVLSFRHAEMK